jgi:hypothetical protein
MATQLIKDLRVDQANLRSLEEAMAEVERELNIRMKCFDRWVAEGRLGWIDAQDRVERLLSARLYLQELARLIETPTVHV